MTNSITTTIPTVLTTIILATNGTSPLCHNVSVHSTTPTPRPTCADLRKMCFMTGVLTIVNVSQPTDTNNTKDNSQDINKSIFVLLNQTSTTTTEAPRVTKQVRGPPNVSSVECQMYIASCNPNRRKPLSVHTIRLIFTMCLLGVLCVVLNLFVIFRILYQSVKKIHQSKLYFLSMAFADLYYGLCCFIYTMAYYKFIDVRKSPQHYDLFSKWWTVSIPLSLVSSLFHVLMITADRFLATTFPLFHKIHMTRGKLMITIFFLWVLAFILAMLPMWLKSALFSTWFYSIVGTAGTFLLIATYTHISVVAVKRRRTLKQLARNKNNVKKSTKSINTTFLSISITSTYIICMLFSTIYALMHLITGMKDIMELNFVEIVLVEANAAINPILYTIFEFLHHKIKERRIKSQSTSETGAQRKITGCTVVDNSKESSSDTKI